MEFSPHYVLCQCCGAKNFAKLVEVVCTESGVNYSKVQRCWECDSMLVDYNLPYLTETERTNIIVGLEKQKMSAAQAEAIFSSDLQRIILYAACNRKFGWLIILEVLNEEDILSIIGKAKNFTTIIQKFWTWCVAPHNKYVDQYTSNGELPPEWE